MLNLYEIYMASREPRLLAFSVKSIRISLERKTQTDGQWKIEKINTRTSWECPIVHFALLVI